MRIDQSNTRILGGCDCQVSFMLWSSRSWFSIPSDSCTHCTQFFGNKKKYSSIYFNFKKNLLYSFECPDFTTYDTNKCHLSGKTFNVGDDVEGDIIPHCRAACKCLKFGAATHIVCADVECFNTYVPERGCINQYNDVKQCCRTSEICGNSSLFKILKHKLLFRTYKINE